MRSEPSLEHIYCLKMSLDLICFTPCELLARLLLLTLTRPENPLGIVGSSKIGWVPLRFSCWTTACLCWFITLDRGSIGEKLDFAISLLIEGFKTCCLGLFLTFLSTDTIFSTGLYLLDFLLGVFFGGTFTSILCWAIVVKFVLVFEFLLAACSFADCRLMLPKFACIFPITPGKPWPICSKILSVYRGRLWKNYSFCIPFLASWSVNN